MTTIIIISLVLNLPVPIEEQKTHEGLNLCGHTSTISRFAANQCLIGYTG